MRCPQKGKVGLEVPWKTVKSFLTGKALRPGAVLATRATPGGVAAFLKAEVARLA